MAEDRLSPEMAAEFIVAIRAKDLGAIAGIRMFWGDKAEEFINTPISVDGGKRSFFLTEAVNTQDALVVSALLEAGALPEKRTHDTYGQNAFYATSLTRGTFNVMLRSLRERAGENADMALHEALVGGKGQRTESCLFTLLDEGRSDAFTAVLSALPNDSSRHEAITQLASPLGFKFDKKAEFQGYTMNPSRAISLQLAAYFANGHNLRDELTRMQYSVQYSNDPKFYSGGGLQTEWQVTPQQRKTGEMKLKLQTEKPDLAQLKEWIGDMPQDPLPPPLAKRFLDAIAALPEQDALSTSFNGNNTTLASLIESFGSDAAEILNTPVLKADGKRSLLLFDVVAKGNTPALEAMLAAGADPAKRLDGTSGPNAFYVENIKPLHVRKMVDALRAGHEEPQAADIAVHKALNGGAGQVTPPALVIQVDAANYGAAEEIFNALPNRQSKSYAIDYCFSPLDFKFDKEADKAGIFLSIDKCFSVTDILELRIEKLPYATQECRISAWFFEQEGRRLSSYDRVEGDFYHDVAPKQRQYMVNPGTRQQDETRFRELREKETRQQQEYRDMLRGALEERAEAEQALKSAQLLALAEERKLRNTAAEIAQLEDQVRRNAEVLQGLNGDRTKLRRQLKM